MTAMVMPEPSARPTLAEPPTAPAELKLMPTPLERPGTYTEMRPMPNPTTPEPPALPPRFTSSSHAGHAAEHTMTATDGSSGPRESSRIKHAIETECGSAVNRVQLYNQADHTVLVRIFLNRTASEKAVTEKLLHIPEVVHPGVKMELLFPE
jgi:hypothetical protein